MKNLAFLLALLIALPSLAQKKALISPSIKKVEPTNWWVGMKNPELQLLVYGPAAGTLTFSVNYPGVRIVRTNKVENPNYAFLDLTIAAETKAGTMKLVAHDGMKTYAYSFELKERDASRKPAGISTGDLIYLAMPDRFSNGDTTNDKLAVMDPVVDRKSPFHRHGGDFKGIINHLDYLQEAGVTALWMTPIIANDEAQKKESHGSLQSGYHGYHFTEYYQVDKRFGGNEGYLQLSRAVHERGMKLVQDAVYNHVSDDHWMYKDPPTDDWFNNWPSLTVTSHKEQALLDPHAAEIDKKVLLDGWFTSFLPDVNQRNPLFATYLIQNAIWWTETFQVDGWRIDTYKYNDQPFMNRCNQALLDEYPAIHIFGESMMNNALNVSYFVRNNINYPFKSNLPGTLDFPVNFAILDALRQNFGWDEGVNKLYSTLAQDFVYENPDRNVTSLDNHDLDRFYSVVGEDFDKFKIGVTWLLTTRGIPSVYYGTEILMKNFKSPVDAEVRRDFPGGFSGDTENKFTAAGRSVRENDAFNYFSKLAQYRKATPALHAGKLMQFLPIEGVYVYFRYDAEKTIMIATNSMKVEKVINTDRFNERLNGFHSARNILTGERVDMLGQLKLGPMSVVVLELAK